MAETSDPARRVLRTGLARDARRLADELEKLFVELEQVGMLASIRRYMIIHSEGLSGFDMLQAAKALRSYSGVLTLVSASASKPNPPAGRKLPDRKINADALDY